MQSEFAFNFYLFLAILNPKPSFSVSGGDWYLTSCMWIPNSKGFPSLYGVL